MIRAVEWVDFINDVSGFRSKETLIFKSNEKTRIGFCIMHMRNPKYAGQSSVR